MFYTIRKTLTGIVLTLFLPLACGGDTEGELASNTPLTASEEFRVLESGTQSQYKSKSTLIFTSSFDWEAHYRNHIGNDSSLPTALKVDFTSEYLIAIHIGEKINPSYSISVSSVGYDSTDNTVQVRYKENVDDIGVYPQVIAYPFTFVKVHRSDLEFRFIDISTL
jgi:hypothetical protein